MIGKWEKKNSNWHRKKSNNIEKVIAIDNNKVEKAITNPDIFHHPNGQCDSIVEDNDAKYFYKNCKACNGKGEIKYYILKNGIEIRKKNNETYPQYFKWELRTCQVCNGVGRILVHTQIKGE